MKYICEKCGDSRPKTRKYVGCSNYVDLECVCGHVTRVTFETSQQANDYFNGSDDT